MDIISTLIQLSDLPQHRRGQERHEGHVILRPAVSWAFKRMDGCQFSNEPITVLFEWIGFGNTAYINEFSILTEYPSRVGKLLYLQYRVTRL